MKHTPRRYLADAVVFHEGHVLLIQRKYEPYKDCWALPGGHVEPDETAEQACLRELKEETGLVGRNQRFLGLWDHPGRDPRGPTVSAAFLVEADATGWAAGDDAASVEWFPLNVLPPLAFDHKQIIRAALKCLGALAVLALDHDHAACASTPSRLSEKVESEWLDRGGSTGESLLDHTRQ